MWKIQKDYHESGALAVFEQDGTPVLVAATGRYPQAVADDGRTTKDTPYILISVGGGSNNGVPFYSGVTVRAVGTWHNGCRRELTVFSDSSYDGSRQDTTADRWVALGKSKISEALEALSSLDAHYAAAHEIVSRAMKYQAQMSRDEYEAACAECGIDTLSDTDCLGYGVKYGKFSFPEYTAAHVAKMHLATRRMMRLESDRDAVERMRPVAPEAKPVRQGQLWEPCERCGAEPVYMPLRLCEKCWPK